MLDLIMSALLCNFGDLIDITDVFQDYESLVEFLISSGHLFPHIGSA